MTGSSLLGKLMVARISTLGLLTDTTAGARMKTP